MRPTLSFLVVRRANPGASPCLFTRSGIPLFGLLKSNPVQRQELERQCDQHGERPRPVHLFPLVTSFADGSEIQWKVGNEHQVVSRIKVNECKCSVDQRTKQSSSNEQPDLVASLPELDQDENQERFCGRELLHLVSRTKDSSSRS